MATLAQIIAHHGCILVLDAASATVQVGLLRAKAEPIWQTSSEESGQSLFTCTAACLKDAGLKMHDVRAFVFCEGPGSMLGIRTVVMAIRTWQSETPRPAFRYQSLALAAHSVWSKRPGIAFAMIADARRETWHCQTVGADGRMSALQRLSLVQLPPLPLFTPENFRTWSVPPTSLTSCSYDLAEIVSAAANADYFYPTDAPDAFQHEAPDYKKWSAQTHSAATAPVR